MHTLLKGLEKIAASADIPMLVAGDFNAVPGSAAHVLLVRGSVDPAHPVSSAKTQNMPASAPDAQPSIHTSRRCLIVSQELSNDPLGILRPASKLQHQLPLASAYTAVAAAPDADHAILRQKRRCDPVTGEPRFTNLSR